MNVQIPALAEDRDHRRAGFDQRIDAGVLLDGVARQARGSEGDQPRVLERERRLARAKKSLSFGFEPGQPPSI